MILNRVKIGFAFILAWIIYPAITYNPDLLPNSLITYFIVLFNEIFWGLIIGFVFYIIFIGIQYAGEVIGIQMGFGIVNVLDPQARIQISIIGQFFYLVALIIFISINGHYYLIEAVFRFFEILPPGAIVFSSKFLDQIIKISTMMFFYMFKLGAPVVITLLLTDIAFGMIARTVPQMNIFIVGFPIKIIVSFVTIILSFSLWGYVFIKLLNSFLVECNNLIGIL